MSLSTLGVFSLLSFLLTLLLVPLLLVCLPADHFLRERSGRMLRRSRLIHGLLVIARNAAGVLLLGLGLVLLVLPGQGLLTILLGLLLMDFPGKRSVELRLLRQPRLLHGLNRLRQRFGRPPLQVPKA